VKFLVDAQLPVRLARFLVSAGHDVLHTADLPDGNRTADGRIAALADGEDRSLSLKTGISGMATCCRGPAAAPGGRATGSITNSALLGLFEAHLDAVLAALDEADFVELGPGSLVVHRRR
jgi:predicted nuclease of predicted toxin-antitoxin system